MPANIVVVKILFAVVIYSDFSNTVASLLYMTIMIETIETGQK